MTYRELLLYADLKKMIDKELGLYIGAGLIDITDIGEIEIKEIDPFIFDIILPGKVHEAQITGEIKL